MDGSFRAWRLGMRGLVTAAFLATAAPLAAQEPTYLAREHILLYGLGLRVEPAQQTVPRGIATVVSTYLHAGAPPGQLPLFAPDAEVRATLRGPSFAGPLRLTTRPNTPFDIPPLTVAGAHTLEDICLVSGGEVLLRGVPESVRIDVIDRLLVTQVTARPLTAQEIREKGIVFDPSSFQAYDFRAAFAIDEGLPVEVAFPVVLPTVGTARDVRLQEVELAAVEPPMLRDLRTLVPDTLRIQTRLPNLSVTGFVLQYDPAPGAQDFWVPPIPGVIVIPGDIGFLNQFFSVLLMVGNVAPVGSRLVVTDLTATIVLPPGRDQVVNTDDDPLRMARRATGEVPRVQAVRQAGPDGQLGTVDDLATLGSGETGTAEFLVEGRREGTHVVEMEIAGTLTGLPVGPVPVRGRAAGAVLVRNPRFTLAFTHPDIVNAGEPYTLDVTVTNTSEAPANFVTLTLDARQVSGATLVGETSQYFDTIAPSDSVTATFHLVALRTGRVTAATLDADEQVAGRFQLKTAIGEFGVPLSPDSLVLPKEAGSLPKALREAALGLLGRAWAIATAPPAAVPANLRRFSRQVVLDHAVAVAEAGLRHTLGEPLAESALHLLADLDGSNYVWLADRAHRPEDLPFLRDDHEGFDLLRRASFRGDVLAATVAGILADPLRQQGPLAFHRGLATTLTSRAPHLSVLVSSPSGPLPLEVRLIDPAGRELGRGTAGKITKDVPFSDYLPVADDAQRQVAALALVTTPVPGRYTVRLAPGPDAPDAARYDVSLVWPDDDGRLRFASWSGLRLSDLPIIEGTDTSTYRVVFDLVGAPGLPSRVPALPEPVIDPAPRVMAVTQMADADRVGCEDGATYQAGRVVGVLFSEQVVPASVQDRAAAHEIDRFSMTGNRAVGVALQPGRRIAYVALRDPVGPFVPVALTIEGATDRLGQVMAPQTEPVRVTVTEEAGVVTGRVLDATGTPVPGADIRLLYQFECAAGWREGGGRKQVTIGIAAKRVDDEGRFAWNYVLKAADPVKLIALDAREPDEHRAVRFVVSRDGQRLEVNVVFVGRGTLRGRALAEDGRTPLPGTQLRVTSLTDQSQFGATADATGMFEIRRVPVGNVLIEAVETSRPASIVVSEHIPFAGAVVTRDLELLDIDMTGVVVRHGSLQGHVLRRDGLTAVADVPVIAYYANRSQPGVRCPPPPPPAEQREPAECAVAVARTDPGGAFEFPRVVAGTLRVYSFDQAALAEGEVRVDLRPDTVLEFNLLIGGGLGRVHGVVIDRDGRPVPDARVGGGLTLTTVDAEGRFTLLDVPVGRREIVAVSDALQSTGRAVVDLVREGEEVHVTIVMEAVGGVAGIVRRHDGQPAAGITVYALQVCYDPQGNEQICVRGQATTGTDGAYRIDRLLVGRYTISAFTADLTDGNLADIVIRYHRQVVRQDLGFRGSRGRVRGTVYAADGVTPLRARVGISGDRLVVAGGRVGVRFEYVQNWAIVDTDLATGRFEFSGVWVGPFTLRAAGQFSPDPVTFQGTMPHAGAEVELALRLQPTSRVSGIVYEPDGVTPAGGGVLVTFKSDAVIVLCSEDQWGISQCQAIPQGVQELFAVTDAAGRFLLAPVNAGAFTLTVEQPATGRLAQVKGSVRAGEEADLGIRLLGRATVQVRVVANDGFTPIAGARVTVNQIDHPRATRVALADSGGVATFAGGDDLGEGEFVVAAVDLRNGFAGRATGRVTADTSLVTVVVRLADATGTVAGTVYRDDGLTPVPNAEVVVTQAGKALAFAVSDATGAYAAPLIPVGTFAVDVFDPATGARGYDTGRITYDGQEFVLPIRLDPLGLLHGTVVESRTLAPLKGWEVVLTQVSRSGRSLPERRSTSGVDGSFSFPGATVGRFQLTARHRQVVGSGRASGEIIRPDQAVEVPLVVSIVRRVTGRVTGTVHQPDGQPARHAEVELCAGGEACRYAPAGPDGTFAFEDVPLGRFTARARAQLTGNVSEGVVIGDLFFEGDTAEVTITLVGLATIEGRVIDAGGTPVSGAQVKLFGLPGTGCAGPCQQFTDAAGVFRFVDVPARSFTVVATHPLTGLRGSTGDIVRAGETRRVDVRLQPGARVTGRVLLPNGDPAAGAVIRLVRAGATLYAEADSGGHFLLDAVALGPITVEVEDPAGPGTARREEPLTGDLDLGDLLLDDAPPMVASVTPASGAIDVPLSAVVRLAFTEPVRLATVLAPGTVRVSGPEGDIAGFVEIEPGSGDSVAVFHPIGPLRDQTRYTVRVSGVQDRVGKTMAAPFTSTFTTVDLTAPGIVEVTPAAGTTGVAITSVIRVRYNESINPARFRGPPVTLVGPAGPVDGRVDFLAGNTLLVFSPARPLSTDAAYQVEVAAASDLAGNQQVAATRWSFTTTDGTPPIVISLDTAAGATSCASPVHAIERTIVSLTARTTPDDVAFVDFFIGDTLVHVDRQPPFTLDVQAGPPYGRAGQTLLVAAVATDTSGNRGLPLVTCVAIDPDQPPAVTIVEPVGGTSIPNGQTVTVRVHAADDVGLVEIGFSARTGRARDAAVRLLAAPVTATTQTFSFILPVEAVPGSSIGIEASARDSAGQTTTAQPVEIRVLDGVAPVVTVSGLAPGTRLQPGQNVTLVVSAEDAAGVTALGIRVSGAASFSDQRAVSPAQPAVATSFGFTVAPDAQPTDRVVIEAFALDHVGNRGTAGPLVVDIADRVPPTVTLRVAGPPAALVPGRATVVVADATDEVGVARIAMAGAGAFAYADAKSISPPLPFASASFLVNTPASVTPGATLTLQARAIDVSGNASEPATLVLTAIGLAEVTLPSSLIVAAGDVVDLPVTLSAPAPPGGLVVTFSTSTPGVVSVPAPLAFAEGEQQRTASVRGLAGGTTGLSTRLLGVERATTTVTVIGGVIRGVVRDPDLRPVADAQVSVFHGETPLSTTTDTDGRFFVSGVSGQTFTVRARLTDRRLLGQTSGSLDVRGGSAQVEVVMLEAGVIGGRVLRPDGITPAGAGVRVDLATAARPMDTLASTFTGASGTWQFDLVALGDYVVQVSDAAGNRGRREVAVTADAPVVDIGIVFLGRGTVIGVVRHASGDPVAGAEVRLSALSILGAAPERAGRADDEGRFTFTDVFAGTFTVSARDPVSNLGGATSGTVTADGETVTADVTLAAYANLRGTVYRADGLTVAGPDVVVTADLCPPGAPSSSCRFTTVTDAAGRYRFTFLPFRDFTLTVRDPATRGLGTASGGFTTVGETREQDVVLLGQGTLVVMVKDVDDQPVAGASVRARTIQGALSDELAGVTDAHGIVVLQRLLAGAYTVTASAPGRSETVTGELAVDEVRSIEVVLGRVHLTSIVVVPGALTLVGRGAEDRLQVMGRYSDGTVQRLTTGVSFTSAQPFVAMVSPDGLVTAGDDGTTTITVSVADVAPVHVPVLVKSLVALSATPESLVLVEAGRTRPLTVTGRYSDGSSVTLTAVASYHSSDTSVATVSPTGLVTSTGIGSALITISYGLLTPVTVTITVEARRAVGLQVAPPSLAFTAAGEARQLVVTIEYNDGTTSPPAGLVLFTTSDPLVATVSGGGEVTAVANGTARIDVSADGFTRSVPVVVTIPAEQPGPEITELGRAWVGEGDSLVILGRHFDGQPAGNLVTIAGVPAVVREASVERLIVNVPRGVTSGPVQVTVAGRDSNTVDVQVYARRAEARLTSAPFDATPAPVGEVAHLGAITLDVREGDAVWLTGDPATVVAPSFAGLVGPEFAGALVVTIDGVDHAIVPSSAPVDLSALFTPGDHHVALRLEERGGYLRSRGLALVSGPPGTGAFAGQRFLTGDTLDRRLIVRFRFPAYADGTKVAVTAHNWYRVDGSCCTDSAGGTIIGGVPTPNDGRTRTFTVAGGEVAVTYSSQGLSSPVAGSRVAVVVALPADAAGNRTSDRPVAAASVTLTGLHSGSVIPAWTAELADGSRHPVPVVVESVRDVAGRPVTDTHVAVTAHNWFRLDGACCTDSFGGVIEGAAPVPNDGRMRAVTLVDGRADFVYSPTDLRLSVGDVRTASIVVLAADAGNNKIGERPFALGRITLSAPTAGRAVYAVQPPSLPATSLDNRALITIAGLSDSLGRPVPDGTKFALTAVNWYRTDGSCCTDSAGGTLLDGIPTPNDGRMRTYEAIGGQMTVTYSAAGLVYGPGTVATAVVVVLPADGAGNRVGDRPILAIPVRLAAVSSGTIVPGEASVVGDGGVHPVSVTVSGIRDALGNPVPDGTRVALTAVNWYRPDGSCCTDSVGGTFLDGTTAANDGRFRVYTTTNGRVDATYSPTDIRLAVGDVRAAVIVAVIADAANNRRSDRPFAAGTITVSSVTGATVTASPASLVADTLPRLSTITITDLADSQGRPIPDGTNVALTAANWYRLDGSCCNNSAGGSFTDGGPVPNDGRYRSYVVSAGQVRATYTAQGLFVGTDQTRAAVISLLPADPAGNRVGDRPLANVTVTLAGLADGTFTLPPSLPALATATVSLTDIRDALGNPVPDGTPVALSAINWYGRDGSCCTNSAGGTFLDGVAAPNDSRFRVYRVTDGRIDATFQAPDAPNRTTVIVAVGADAANNRREDKPFAVGTIPITTR